MEYRRVWVARLGQGRDALMALLSTRDERLRLEARLASEAGFAEYEVIVEPVVSSAERALPPVVGADKQDHAEAATSAASATRLNVFAAPGAPNDYLHRLQIAASGAFARFGVRSDAAIGA
jgi:hypothetical protein